MKINKDILNFFDIIKSLHSNINLYLTDLDNILISIKDNDIDLSLYPINKTLLKTLLIFNSDSCTDNIKLDNKSLINIFEDSSNNIPCLSQIVFPIIVDDCIVGSIILINKTTNFNYAEFELIQSSLIFLKAFILKQMHEKYIDKKNNGKL